MTRFDRPSHIAAALAIGLAIIWIVAAKWMGWKPWL